MVTLKEKALLVKLFYQNNSNAAAALREFRKLKDVRRGPMSDRGVHKMIKKFEETGKLDILPGRGRKKVDISSIEDIATAAVDLASQSSFGNASVPAIANEVDMPISTVRKVMRQILRYYPYKIQRVQQLIQGDTESRLSFSLQFLARMNVDNSWPWNILWSDEAHFYLNGQVNTHNCRIWAKENPNVVQEVPLHAAKVTVWCGFTATFMIGPYFFEELTSTGPITCSVNGRRYLNMLSNFLIPELQQRGCLQNIVFMQDGAPPHITRAVRTFLTSHFTEDRIISRYFQTLWPPRSPDLTPCDFWLWGFLKDSVSKDRCQTISDLK